jgi:hypothetical protein
MKLEPPGDPLRLYTDTRLIPPGAVPAQLLFPFVDPGIAHNGYARLAEEGRSWIELVEPDRAEVALLPFDGRYLIEPKLGLQAAAVEAGRELAARATAAGLRTLVLVNSDSDAPVPLEGVIVLRTSLSRRTRQPFEFALPAWHEDLLTTHFGGQLELKPRGPQPVVGFCGLAASDQTSRLHRLKDAARNAARAAGFRIPYRDGIFLRSAAMAALEHSPRVETRFTIRPACFHGEADAATRATQRQEYLRNIVETDYTLCLRGYGNYSFRFFEAMSLGRPPLLIDTDCVLPLDFLLDYRPVTVIVPQNHLRRAADYAARHHAALDDQSQFDLQRRVRAFWAEWLAPERFFRSVALHWRRREAAAPAGTAA